MEAYHRLLPLSVPSRSGETCSMVGGALAPMQGCSQAGTQLQHNVSTQCGRVAAVSFHGHVHSVLSGAGAPRYLQRLSHSALTLGS